MDNNQNNNVMAPQNQPGNIMMPPSENTNTETTQTPNNNPMVFQPESVNTTISQPEVINNSVPQPENINTLTSQPEIANTGAPQSEPAKNNKAIIFVLLGVILILVIVIVVMFLINNRNAARNSEPSGVENTVIPNTNNNTEDDSNSVENTDNKEIEPSIKDDGESVVPLTTNDFTQVTVNNILIKFPATKESFNGTGWTWDEKYATKKIDTGYTSSGGRIGTYPGGVVVSVINVSGEIKEIQDCTIDDGTFYNPKDGSNSVVFVGGLTFSSTKEQVKAKMAELGYSNLKESQTDALTKYKYYKLDDENNYKDYIEFSFYNDALTDIGIYTSGK